MQINAKWSFKYALASFSTLLPLVESGNFLGEPQTIFLPLDYLSTLQQYGHIIFKCFLETVPGMFNGTRLGNEFKVLSEMRLTLVQSMHSDL